MPSKIPSGLFSHLSALTGSAVRHTAVHRPALARANPNERANFSTGAGGGCRVGAEVICYLKMAEKAPVASPRRSEYLNRAVGACCLLHWDMRQGSAVNLMPQIKQAYKEAFGEEEAARRLWSEFTDKTNQLMYLGAHSGKG